MKKRPVCEHLAWAEDDAKQHPIDSKDGYYTSMAVIKIFPEIKMDAFQEWIKKELIRPVFVGQGPTGWIKYFNRSGLIMIAIFKRLIDFGVQREHARSNMILFHRERLRFLKEYAMEPDFILFEKKNKFIKNMDFLSGEVQLDRAMADAFIVNLHQIIFKIDAYIDAYRD